jgi:hypothetical protein
VTAPVALAQQPASGDHPGYWGDVMPPPAPEATYGAGRTSTKRMVEWCTELETSMRKDENGAVTEYARDYQSGYCLGWINSAMAFFNFHNEAEQHTLAVCMPETIESTELLRLFLEYVNRNIEDTKYNPSLLLYWALLEKYPCTE